MSRPALLDVNLLVALFDPDHLLHHEPAQRPGAIARRLGSFRASGHHVFWPYDVSVCDTRAFSLSVGHRQLTDVYLLALAVTHGGRLATFDRSIPLKAVRAARPDHLVVIDA